MKVLVNLLGVLLLLAGAFFILEGAQVLSLVAFSHHLRYLIGGIVLVVVAVLAFVFANRRRSLPPAD